MNQHIKTSLIAFSAGIAGAFIFGLFSPRSETTFIERENSPFRFANNQISSTPSVNFIKASALSTPSVVYIKTTTGSNNDNYNWYDYFFNGRSGTQISSGSGVIYSKDGYIITNSHVIDKAQQIEVIHNKRSYSAKVIGIDPSTDLAVIKVEATNLPAMKIGTSKTVQVGEWVLAVGNPFNLTSTVTAGIVSAKARDIRVVNSRFPIESFIQTDAAINPGNSGGALVNIEGELVGINTAILSQTGSYTGYGFAVPIDIVKKAVTDLIEFGEVQKSFFGADVADMNTEFAKKLNVVDLDGVFLSQVRAGEAADKAGLKAGDIILKIDGVTVDSRAMFNELISYHRPGDKIKVSYLRENKPSETIVSLTNIEGGTGIIKREIYKADRIGAELENVSKIEKGKLSIGNGVRLYKVTGGLMSRLGIQEGFIITAINGVKINTPLELEDILANIRGRVTIEGVTNEGGKGYYSYYF